MFFSVEKMIFPVEEMFSPFEEMFFSVEKMISSAEKIISSVEKIIFSDGKTFFSDFFLKIYAKNNRCDSLNFTKEKFQVGFDSEIGCLLFSKLINIKEQEKKMADFLTKLSDSELKDRAEQISTKITGSPSSYSATAGQATDLVTKKDAFSSDLTAHIAAQDTARAKTLAKKSSRDALESAIRFLIKQAKLNGVSDEALAELGVPTEPESAMPSTATRPVGSIDTSQRFIHTIHFADEAASESKRNPRGVLGCEIHQKIGGEPPADSKECIFRGLDTKTPYTWEFDAADVGKMVHYMLRWRFRDESTSNWSETVSATVTG
jgi:hypothetical protein